MDPADAFPEGLGSVNRARQARPPRARESSHDSEESAHRIAHTLAACCRCRQRKTKCDPNLPRCHPCERAGAVCEYFDTSKGRKISRTYVIRLQDKVRALEAELGQFTEEESTPPNPEDAIRPGGLVRLDENDATPRFLGPSSGIAMTRLVMEEAKKYTDSRSIRELVPEVVARRTPATSPESWGQERKKSYPMISAVPAPNLPSRLVTDKLVEVFNQRAHYLLPTLHEPTFAREVDEVYAGTQDDYKNFVVRMVLAISMQKLDSQYAGLADSYYLAAMAHVEAVIRPKDLKTLQCLVLIAQYSLLTPTRTAIYYIVGLATRLCQQLGLTEEKNLVQGVSVGMVDKVQLDMRRRLSWIVLSMEFGLSHSLGRPNGFATGQDHVDVGFFEAVDDTLITPERILQGPPSEKKIMAVHFFKMRLLQAEIRRMLYQGKRVDPRDDRDPWFGEMERKMRAWLDDSPIQPSWARPWFNVKLNTMMVFLYRPSPQIPKPSVHAAILCYDAAAFNVKASGRDIENPAIDITWIFLQSLFMAINTLLWTISFKEVRSLHPREELEDHLRVGINIIIKCRDRWPGCGSAAQLYETLGKACLKSYDVEIHHPSSLSANSPASLTDANSPSASEHSAATGGSIAPSHKAYEIPQPPPTFGYIFNEIPNSFAANAYYNSSPAAAPAMPAFRSGSIFASPSSTQGARRVSYFPPELSQQQQNQPSPLPPQQTLPNSWTPLNISAPPPPQPILTNHTIIANTSTSPPLPPFNSYADTSYLINPTYNFGYPQFFGTTDTDFAMPDRRGSLSHSQQAELMDSLENEGLSGIDSFLNLGAAYYDPGKS